jgi:RNase P/RNase MRP subunit p30
MFDLVFCADEKKKNEFRQQGKKLRFENVYFIEHFKGLKESNADVSLIVAKNKQDLSNQVSKASILKKPIFVLGSDDEVNRAALENKKVSCLLSPEYERKKDFMHSRNSGLNQVLCKIAVKNNAAIGVNFNGLHEDKKEAALRLGRIIQNIRFCSKYKVKVLIASFSAKPEEMVSAYDLRSFCSAIGMNTKMAKEALLVLEKIVSKQVIKFK